MKHIKGPWKIGITKNQRISINAGIFEVAEVHESLFDDQGDANARLIAAAPELLDFVRGVYIEQLGHGPNADMVIVRKAQELLHKVTGEVFND